MKFDGLRSPTRILFRMLAWQMRWRPVDSDLETDA